MDVEMKKAKSSINEKRTELDRLDGELVKLFEERLGIAREIGLIKAESGLPLLDSVREKEIIDNRKSLLSNPAFADMAEAFFTQLMDFSKDVQREIQGKPALFNVAYQGITGSYGHEAAIRYFGTDVPLIHNKQFVDALEAVASGRAKYAVLPVENSIAGMVNQTLDVLVNYRCYICGEVVLPISHSLLALPGASMDDIRTVCSHQQAIMQCSDFLYQHSSVTTSLMDNTAVSARHVAGQKDKSMAAIASRTCAKLYGLDILAENIQDKMENYTRFIVVAGYEDDKSEWNKISARFALPHESGSLYEMLRIPAEYGVNLTSIVSRPYPDKSFQYHFYIDMTSNSKEQAEKALQKMSEKCIEWVVLGKYPSAERRPKWESSTL